MGQQRVERAGELDELRRLIGDLRALYANYPTGGDAWDREDYQTERARRRGLVAAEVRRLRRLPEGRWTLGQLAEAFGVSRSSIQQWERPALDRRRPPPVAVVWIGTGGAVACGLGRAWAAGLGRVVCHVCRLVG